MLDHAEKCRRNALSNDEAMADAQRLCVPCKLCGGAALITDAGPGYGYYIRCENSWKSNAKDACMVHDTRLSGWAYNVMDLWNRQHGAIETARAKALEWRRGYCDARVTIEQASFGWLYQVRKLDGVIYLDWPDRAVSIFETVDAAKAAAQKDFEHRIQSALTTSTGQKPSDAILALLDTPSTSGVSE